MHRSTFTSPRIPLRGLLAIPFMVAAVAACESEVAAPEEETFNEGVISIDATSPASFAYVSLTGGGALRSPVDPGGSTSWDMAFRRFSVRLNGGVAGPGSVSAVSLGNNADLTADQVTALTPQDGEAAFAAVTEADIPAAGFVEDALAPETGPSWFRFDRQSGAIVANPGAAWKLREGSGRGYGVIRMVDIAMQGERPVGATIEFRRHDPGGSLGAPETAALDLTRGPVYLSLSNGIVRDPASCDWDVATSPEFTILVNEACGAGTFARRDGRFHGAGPGRRRTGLRRLPLDDRRGVSGHGGGCAGHLLVQHPAEQSHVADVQRLPRPRERGGL